MREVLLFSERLIKCKCVLFSSCYHSAQSNMLSIYISDDDEESVSSPVSQSMTSASTIVIDDDDDDDDEDTLMDRSAYVARFKDTLLAPLANLFQVRSPKWSPHVFRPISDDTSVNQVAVDIVLWTQQTPQNIRLTIWQAPTNYRTEIPVDDEHLHTIDLERLKSDDEAIQGLRNLGWNIVQQVSDLFLIYDLKKAKTKLLGTMECLSRFIRARCTEETRSLDLFFCCKVGLERSLVLLNLLAYALHVLRGGGTLASESLSLGDVLQSSLFQPRTERREGKVVRQAGNVSLVVAMEQMPFRIPTVMGFTMEEPETPQLSPRKRATRK